MAREAAWAGGALGFGLSGAFDVALFHLVLQWHHITMAAAPAARLRADGLLLLALVLVAAAGGALAWRAGGRDGRGFAGGTLVGIGLFNAGDVAVDHGLLRLHSLLGSGPPGAADAVWFGASALVLVWGVALLRPRPAR